MRTEVFAVLLVAGCASGARRAEPPRWNPDDARRRLEEAETAAQKDPSQLARAGWLRYLTASDASGALRELEPASRTGTPAQRALALAGLGAYALTSGSPSRRDCVDVTFASTLGGASVHACGGHARRLCASGGYRGIEADLRAACARAGFPFKHARRAPRAERAQ